MRCTHLFTLSHWLKGLAVSFHLIHGHSHAHWCLSVFFLVPFYFLLKFLFHLFLLLAMVPNDSMNNPLCHSAIGSMVTFDYCTPDTSNLATSPGVLRREGIEKSGSEELLQSIPLHCFQERARQKNLDGGICPMSMASYPAAGIRTCTQSSMTIRSYPSSEMHLGNFPDHTEFQSWVVNFRTEVFSKSKNPTLALQWIKEIETAKSLEDLITPKSTTGKHFPDCEELDLMMAAALKRCYDKHTHFRKKISVEEQRAQKNNRFLTGRQVAYLVYEYFRPTGSQDEIQGLSGPFSIKFESDDIQDFDLRWEQASLLTSDPPSDTVLEGLYVSKLQDSSKIQTIMALFQSRNSPRRRKTRLSQIENVRKIIF